MFEASVRVVCACELVRVHAPVGRRWAIKRRREGRGFYRRVRLGGEICDEGFSNLPTSWGVSVNLFIIDLIYFLSLSSPQRHLIHVTLSLDGHDMTKNACCLHWLSYMLTYVKARQISNVPYTGG